jgi:PAS domain S-box-containing protein
MDKNYPPYVFQDNTGALQGILIDQWRLWEQKSGIKVEILAMDWGKAISGMKAGEFDVIDTLFKTDERSGWLDFSKPYATIEVPIFFDKNIGGITDAASLKGFVVADKHGDAMIDVLRQNGVGNVLLFDSFEELVQAAKEHKVNVFVMGKPPALYFLTKYGIDSRFRQSAPLHVNQFYRAVKKGNSELLKIVDDGFAAITPDQLKKIDNKWHGSALRNNFPTAPILLGLGGLSLLVMALLAWNRTLKNSVEKRTAELKHTEESLRRNEEKFRKHVENSTDVIFTLNSEGIFKFVSPAWERHFGHPVSEVVGRSITPFAHPDDIPHVVEYLQRVLGSGKAETSPPCRVKCVDGFWRLFEANGSTFVDPGGELLFIGVGHDISERKKNEEERLNLERQLLHSQKLESLGILSGGIAHDFNNLLQALLGNLDLALMRLPQDSPAGKNINQAIKAGCHAAQLTSMMLAYSGKGVFVIKPLNLTELVEENASMLEAAMPKSITLEQLLDHELPIIRADAGQLQQVVMNLITNAAEAIGNQGGKIRLSTGVREFDQETLNSSRLEEKLPAGRYVWVKVCDSGCGMDESTLQKLFDPFFTTKFTGRGLGMSAVLGIIRAHKGAFLVESRLELGTIIEILFPIAEETVSGTGNSEDCLPVNEKLDGSPIRVLVVDDEDMIRSVSAAMLKELGFEAIAVASGEEALEIFRRDHESISLVLLDQVMPGMDGVAVFKELRSIKPGIKVVIASGFSQMELSERFKGLELDGFLPKPYTLRELEAELRQVISVK